MKDFAPKLNKPDNRDKKLTDFISRLRGFLDILGPNPQGNSPDGDQFSGSRSAPQESYPYVLPYYHDI